MIAYWTKSVIILMQNITAENGAKLAQWNEFQHYSARIDQWYWYIRIAEQYVCKIKKKIANDLQIIKKSFESTNILEKKILRWVRVHRDSYADLRWDAQGGGGRRPPVVAHSVPSGTRGSSRPTGDGALSFRSGRERLIPRSVTVTGWLHSSLCQARSWREFCSTVSTSY